MVNVIDQQIQGQKERPSEFKMSFLERRGNRVAIAMERKKYPGYYRHYVLDAEQCRIVDLKIDQ